MINDDSKTIAMKLKTSAEKLGYSEIHVFENGKDGVKGCKQIFSDNKESVVLFDMGLMN